MQINFECIFKLIAALTFLMCVVCLHYQYSFLMFCFTLSFFSLYVVLFFFIFLNERQIKRK